MSWPPAPFAGDGGEKANRIWWKVHNKTRKNTLEELLLLKWPTMGKYSRNFHSWRSARKARTGSQKPAVTKWKTKLNQTKGEYRLTGAALHLPPSARQHVIEWPDQFSACFFERHEWESVCYQERQKWDKMLSLFSSDRYPDGNYFFPGKFLFFLILSPN